MEIKRRFTTTDGGPYAEVDFHTVTSEIRNPNGSVVFKNDAVEVPSDWSQVASDIIAQKYFRKAGIPAVSRPVEEDNVLLGYGDMSQTTRRSRRYQKIQDREEKPAQGKFFIV